VFYNNADNIMTVTVDKSFSPNIDIPRYTSGKSVQFLTLSTDFEDHGGKSKEGMPLTIKGLYLREFESGRVVLDQTTGSRMHSHNSLIDAVMQYLEDQGRRLTIKSLWNGAVELGLKDADDPNGGWKSEKGARNILESAVERGYLIEVAGSGPVPTSFVRPITPDLSPTWEY
jgi:hypothetical protein